MPLCIVRTGKLMAKHGVGICSYPRSCKVDEGGGRVSNVAALSWQLVSTDNSMQTTALAAYRILDPVHNIHILDRIQHSQDRNFVSVTMIWNRVFG